MLTIKGLAKSFGGRTLFSEVNLEVVGGERIALLGTTAPASPPS